ncbi:HAMP domain-containing histidine kinase [Rhizobium sp. KVB221]|uniref:histidine kinase n=1 Tax=Rhizobium setariae TaxID=2801340 RepID=A0A936YNT4_9HYPH|nr:HAMP domain-containing sensor histidine kinase [Rhizobium setariae]MBL0372107.1 HAMP domain-containing histidine kinase [Rhizobium setariae]
MISIRTRFIIVSLISVTVALSLASWFLVALFADNVEKRIDTELTGHINRLAGSLEFKSDGTLQRPESPADNRFYQAYSGLYWQIDDPARGTDLRSPSLFDYALPLPADEHSPGTVHRYHLKGPEGSDVIVQERALIVAAPGGGRTIRIAVAVDASVLNDAKDSFARAIIPYVAALAVFLVAMSVVQLMIGLRPLSAIAGDLNDVRERRSQTLKAPYPAELSGLVSQLNHLLVAQANAIEKARARASDLAHGLKTPLTVLSNNALTLHDKGETEMAAELDQLAESMLAHVNHELARARIAHSPEQRRSDAPVGKIIDDLVRTLKRTEDGEKLDWKTVVPRDLTLPIDPQDFRDLIGNLLENAAKWARTCVSVTATSRPQGWTITIVDDGPGVAEDKLSQLTTRGLRLDHQKPGSGLGLAITQEIASVYGLELQLENSGDSGLCVTIAGPGIA